MFETQAAVFKSADAKWKRWGCMSSNMGTVWHRSKIAAMRDAFHRIGLRPGLDCAHSVKWDSASKVTTIKRLL